MHAAATTSDFVGAEYTTVPGEFGLVDVQHSERHLARLMRREHMVASRVFPTNIRIAVVMTQLEVPLAIESTRFVPITLIREKSIEHIDLPLVPVRKTKA